eukprot:4863573-Prymnesium_polylepis.1
MANYSPRDNYVRRATPAPARVVASRTFAGHDTPTSEYTESPASGVDASPAADGATLTLDDARQRVTSARQQLIDAERALLEREENELQSERGGALAAK